MGHSVTLADIVAVSNLFHGFTRLYDAEFRKDFSHVVRWFLTCVNQPQFRKVLGNVELCSTPLTMDASKVAAAPKAGEKKAAEPKAAARKAEKKPSEKKAAATEKKAAPAEKKAAAAEKKPEPAPTAAATEEKKAKNPLDLLPPSKMVMDAWKRLYSNTPAR